MNKANIKILLAEDEVITAMFIKMELRKSGFTDVKNIGTGEKAIDIAITDRPDVILMDVNLAGKINGLEAAKEILKTYIPHFIFMTGYQDELILQEIKSLTSSKYLSKPIDHMKMIDLIKILICKEEVSII